MDAPTSTKPGSLESVLEELTRSGSDVSVIVNMPNWNAIPLLIREWNGKNETTICKLLDEMSRILTDFSDLELPLTNKRLLHSALSTLSQTPTLPKKIRTRVEKCVPILNSVPDGPFVLVETEEFRKMEQSLSELQQRCLEMTEHINQLKCQVAQAEDENEKAKTEREKMEEEKKKAEREKLAAETRQKRAEELKGQAEREKEKLSDELGEARNGKEKMDRENELLKSQFDEIGQQLMHSLQPLSRKSSSLQQTNRGEQHSRFRSPRESENSKSEQLQALSGICFGFLKHPLPEDATQNSCGEWLNGIGGHFGLKTGRMWKDDTEFKPEGTNKQLERVGQTTAIRVNMRTREARLFVDEQEQPGIFTNIPSPLCLGISTGFTDVNNSVEVMWLKRLRS
ncbi:hypothetical protein BLNAU_20272 [Blattamonas nauphoetae]|uniref:Uncharacterized protein n=1 Tax=Blattamonas nauphoetae TaxID=2049346 RepID=A0ABQ9X0D1_9EUKA|nr:hypothetical protein BLNAU_20272 [Blattamonas nauphoetae]